MLLHPELNPELHTGLHSGLHTGLHPEPHPELHTGLQAISKICHQKLRSQQVQPSIWVGSSTIDLRLKVTDVSAKAL